MNRERLKDRLILHEGLKLKPYRDQLGFVTIGIGRCLDKKGISKQEAFYLFENDIDDVLKEVAGNIEFFSSLDDIRQEILVEMCFQIGMDGLLKFKRFLSFLEIKDYKSAALEMLDSEWANQTPGRARELSQLMDVTQKV